MKYFFVLLTLRLFLSAQISCDTPIDCYSKALLALNNGLNELHSIETDLNGKIDNITHTLTPLENKVSLLEQTINSQSDLIKSQAELIANQKKIIDDLVQKHAASIAKENDLQNQISARQQEIASINNLISSRGLNQIRVNQNPNEADIYFDVFQGFYGFWNSNRDYGVCRSSGTDCKMG